MLFNIEVCPETGGFVARWDDPAGGGITTQGDTLPELHSMIADAVTGYFEPGKHPKRVRLHFNQDPVVALA
jgi:predicted RNase H-like HicB family nuclease